MYRHNNTSSNDFSYHFSGDLLEHSPVLDNLTVPVPSLQVNCLMIPNNEFDSVSATLMMKQELCNKTTSGGYSRYGSPTSLTSYEAQPSSYMMQKSISSHSLHNNINGFQCHQQLTQFPGFDDSSPVRKVFSTGDLQRKNMVQQQHRSESPLSNESSIIECMNAKACKYSPEEKKEKIEKYRSKRNQRNFNKKIKYVCRKTLADSRPRIRGRFAKNNDDENEKGGQLTDEWNHIVADNHGDLDDDNQNWINFVDTFSANVIP
ncbi:CCT domain-containing protein [Heracleum sosnowskyi]|uniref:CCT domain-containing protein n=1 Tax=Heracleum sosnowskyi TaxID=360622 RepID=A0AAD8H0E2_9APIA|nr:CCT domain-containing protein [Heracleum sosnowskyi]